MRVSRIVIITLLFGLFCVSALAQTYPLVQVPNTEMRILQSDIMDYEYGIYITLPASYRDNPDRAYPTVYIIDGNQYFVFTSEPYGSLVWGSMVKEHISVSVAYLPGAQNMRGNDFGTSRHAPEFIRFFQEELIPFVEKNYRTTGITDRTLFGHSAGGQFTLYTILTNTDTFQNYIACAPAVNDDIMAFEETYAANHSDMPIKMFLAAGEDDHLTIGSRRFLAKFEARNYPGLKFDKLFVVHGNHGTIQPTAYIEGLRFVLAPEIQLAPEKFRRLAGVYVDDTKNKYTVTYNGGNTLSLNMDLPESYGGEMVEWRTIYPRSETQFFSKGWSGNFEFGGDLSKPAETFSVGSGRQQTVAKRQ